MPARKSDKTSRPSVRKPAKGTSRQVKRANTLPESMVTGKASPAKAAVGDKPVFAYIASLPQPQRGIAERIDALAAKTLPALQRSVKWGMSYYGVGDGWCFCCGGFADHVKLMFVNGAALNPVPPVTPVAMGKSTRGVEFKSADDIDERQIAAWMIQVAAMPGVGKAKQTTNPTNHTNRTRQRNITHDGGESSETCSAEDRLDFDRQAAVPQCSARTSPDCQGRIA